MQQTPIAVGQNFLAGLTGGMQAGRNIQQANDQNTLRELGPALMNGDPNALNALAGIDPMAAMQVQRQRTTDARAAENQTYQRGRNEAADSRAEQEFAMRVKEHAATLSEQERQQSAAAIEAGLMQAIPFVQSGDLDGFNSVLRAAGEQPIASMDQAPAVLRRYETVFNAMKDVRDFNAGPKAADEYGRYAQEEAAAGRKPLSRIDYTQAKKGKGTVVYDPTTGKPLVSIGGAATDDTDISSPSSPAAMVSSIDGVLNDPALDFATGFLEWTQNIPGTASRRFGSRVDQLNGQAFLQAFESLKGAGQITEVEGQKATQAIGRLDSAQSADDYRQALNELKGILQIGMERKKTGGVITSDAPGVTEVDLNGTIYRVQKVD